MTRSNQSAAELRGAIILSIRICIWIVAVAGAVVLFASAVPILMVLVPAALLAMLTGRSG